MPGDRATMSARTQTARGVTNTAERGRADASVRPLGALPVLAATVSVGLLILALGDNAARRGASYADPFFWTGLIIVVGPISARLLSRAPSRSERIGLLFVLSTGLYLMKLLHSPTQFTFHDELGHVRSTVDILQTSHLFAPNPLVGAYSVYPGTEIITATLSRLTGLSVFTSGNLVVGLARVALLPALFLLYEEVSGSSRLAGLAALLYAANPNYLFFDAQFAYESFALPLAIFVLIAAARGTGTGQSGRDVPWLAVATVAIAVVVSHHVSSLALVLALIGLAAADALRTRNVRGALLARPATLGVVTLAALVAWTAFAGSKTSQELLPVVKGTVSGLGDLLTGHAGPKRPFSTANGSSDSLLARVVGLAAVLLLLIALAGGARALWRRRPLTPLQALLGLAAVAYPATLVLRLTEAGTETSNRASEFVFVGLAYVAALAVRPRQKRRDPEGTARPRFRLLVRAGAPAAVTVLVLGGLVVGWAPYARLPGPYAPGASSRSIDAVAVATAQWVGENVRPDSVGASDGANSTLLTAYGRMNPQRGQIGGVRVSEIFISPFFGRTAREVMQGDKIRYLVVDRRLADRLPLSDRYFEGGDPPGFKPPVSARALTKFAKVRDLDLVFDIGPLRVYDGARVLSEAREP